MAGHKKKLQSEHAADDIRADALVKATQIEVKKNHDHLRDIPVTNTNYWRLKGKEHPTMPRGIKWGIAGLIIIFVVGFAVSFVIAKKDIAASLAARAGTLQAGVADLQNLDPQSAQQEFSSLSGTSSSLGAFGTLLSLFQGGGGAVRSFADLSSQLSLLSEDFASAENDVFGTIAGGMGTATSTSTGAFASDLNNLRTTLAAIDADSNQLSGVASYLGGASSPVGGEGYLALKTQVENAEHFLDAFVPWFSDASTTHHILVLLENPSEMRPGGGFIGSYADVSISGGAITNVSVHDVADVDATFAPKIVPPVPLQLEEAGFRPADGNWFFDFPTSASETLALFNESGLYAANAASSASGTTPTFDAVVAVTPQVLSDLLSVTGPITLPGATLKNGAQAASTTFASSTLVEQIQKIVQAGQAQNAQNTKTSSGNPTYPKAVIAQLYGAMFQQIASSTIDEKAQIIADAQNWIANKDVMVYASDPDFQSFAESYGATGDQYQLPSNFNGDYLAIANADINSDKSERYVAQTISYDATINADGTLTDHLAITRQHNGNESSYWWYKTTNQDYMQIFVPGGTSLDNESGGITKSVPAPINYARDGYSTDPLVLAIASDTQQSFIYPKVTTEEDLDKEVFGIWSRVYAGTSTQVVFDYSHPLFTMPAAGVQYQFVFERPSGATGDYQIEIDAPLGYVFGENGLATFTYESSSTPGRMIVNLTLANE